MHEQWRATMPGLAADLVAHLGIGWSVDRSRDPEDWHWGFHLDGPGGQRLYVAKGDRYEMPKRITVQGCFPEHGMHPARGVSHEIGVGLARGAAAIVREVELRLLPAYRPALEDAQRNAAAHWADEARREAFADELVGLLAAAEGRRDSDGERLYAGRVDHGSATIRLNNAGDGGTVELRWIDADALREVLAVYAASVARRARVRAEARALTAA